MKHSIQVLTAICLVALLGSCANSPIGDALEGSLQADPQLAENPPFGQSDPNQTDPPSPPDDFVKLPDDFPQEISIYPGSSLEDVTLSTSDRGETETVWTTADPINLVQTYYQNKLQSDNWKIVTRPETEGEGSLVATRDDLKVTINLQPDGQSTGKTQFAIDYSRDPKNIASVPKPTESPSPLPKPSDS
ncbi:MAG: S-layer homology domain-containing protein, partial [Limnospira sp.]